MEKFRFLGREDMKLFLYGDLVMTITLTLDEKFKGSEIEFDKKINFIYGKNGTGKSTITKLLEEQCKDKYDVRIFNGFNSIVGEDKNLNAVLLGEENNEIQKQIDVIQKNISDEEDEIEKIRNEIEREPEEGKTNLFKQKQEAEKNSKDANKALEDFYSKSAKKIKVHLDYGYPIAKTSYDKRDFIDEISSKNKLGESDIEKYRQTLKEEVKTANEIKNINFNLIELVEKVNKLLKTEITPTKTIERIVDAQKRKFAQDGLHLHKAGEHCAFCNNKIEQSVIDELEAYFNKNDEDANNLKTNLTAELVNIRSYQEILNNIENDLDKNEFYTKNKDEVDKAKNNIKKVIKIYEENIKSIGDSLKKKQNDIFSSIDVLDVKLEEDLNKLIDDYNKIVKKNNDNNLKEEKEEAKDKLRFNLIWELCEEGDYDNKLATLTSKEDEKKNIDKLIDDKKLERGKLESEIKKLENEKQKLEKETQNEIKLANEINRILKNYVSFELEHVPNQAQQGFYQIKEKGRSRSVTELSEGEKNIIAFLYFIFKLEEVGQKEKPKIIIFDDPMTSNDDVMQYIIIGKIQNLLKKKQNLYEKLFVLTHNTHFYINVTEGKDDKKNNYFLLSKDAEVISYKPIKHNNQIKTSYDALWVHLRTLYDNDTIKDSSILCNLIRRIIETYTKFNNLSGEEFYTGDNFVLRKLLNVSSHSIDDLETDLTGMTKDQIIQEMKKAFETNNGKNHFNKHWETENNQ